jgi:hypothetical protein
LYDSFACQASIIAYAEAIGRVAFLRDRIESRRLGGE